MIVLSAAALAREVDVKVHDMAGAVTGPVFVEVVGPGGAAKFTPRDNGESPDKVAGDHMYTAHGDVPAQNGQVVVTSGDRTWKGGFAFDAASDPVLLIGLQPDGLAGASTKEVTFVAEPAGGPPPKEVAGSPKASRSGLPPGMWTGWLLGAAAFAGLAAAAWHGARAAARERGP